MQQNPISSVPNDDDFWVALFEQEKTSPPTETARQDDWQTLTSGFNGQPDDTNVEQSNPWQLAQTYCATDEIINLTVIGFNKGGLLVQWKGIQGFVPASQLIDFPQFHVERERLQELASRQDETLKLKIIEADRDSNRLILSERGTLVMADERKNLLNNLEIDAQIEGRVTNLTHFGAFIDLGGIEGLIHISELSWSRVIHPSHILQPGQPIKVIVLSIDHYNERVALSLKQLRSNPWLTVDERYYPDQIVKGIVSNVVQYGAFVLLEAELEGLIHISELAEGSFLHPRNVVKKGDEVTARVLTVDGKNKRLALSLRTKIDTSEEK